MNVVAIRDTLISHALSLGLFSSVSGFEPKSAPPNGCYGVLWLDEIAPARGRSGLASTTMRLVWSFRVGVNMTREPQADIELQILVTATALMAAYSGDFELGGEAASIDLMGAHGAPLAAKAGYIDQDQVKYRVMVITIPIIINDVLTQAP